MKYYLDQDAPVNQFKKAHTGDAGYDLCAAEFAELAPGSQLLVKTGLHVQIPYDCVGLVKSRSGLAVTKGIEAGAGVIDSNYRGEVCVLLHNYGGTTLNIAYGDRIAQLCILHLDQSDPELVSTLDELGTTDRGAKGFGS